MPVMIETISCQVDYDFISFSLCVMLEQKSDT